MTLNVAELVITTKDKTSEGFESVNNALEGLKSRTAHLAEALGVGAFAELIHSSMETADQLNKMSQSTGVSVESLSRLSLSAKLSDVDMETLGKSMGKLDKSIRDAADGTGTGQKAFEYLGISVKDSQGHLKNADQIMAEVSDKFAGLKDGAGKTALAMDIFGKAGAGMIPMLNKGSEELKYNADMSDRLGLTLSTQTARGAEEVNDRFTLMGQATKGMANTMMTQLLPTIDNVSKMFVDSATNANNLHAAFALVDGGIKSLVTAGIIIKNVFAELGEAIGGTLAAINFAMHGNFSEAKKALQASGDDMVKTISGDMDSIAKVWTDSTPAITHAAEESAKKTIDGYGSTTKQAMKKVRDEEYTNALAMLEAELKDTVAYGQKHQKNLDMQLANMLISEKDFSAAKQALTLQDLDKQKHYLEEELLLAQSKNDRLKAIEIQGRLERNKIASEEASGPTAYDAKANKASMSPLELEKKSYQDRLDLAEQYRKNNGEADGRYFAMTLQAQQDHENAITALIQRGAVTRNDFEQMTGMQQLQTHIGLLSNLLNASAQHSRAAFEMMKVAKLAEAAIALPATVMKAYEAGASIGGPFALITGAAYAAVAFGAQMVQMNAINSASFGGSMSSAPAGGGSVGVGALPGQTTNPSVPAGAQTAAAPAATPPQQTVNIVMSGGANLYTADSIRNQLIPALNSAIGDGVTINISGA